MLLFSEYYKIPDLLGDAGSTPSRGYAYDQKGQTRQGEKSVQKQIYLIHEIFGLTA